jgi:murein DD-endopeptidase MepM/ murein hydrolase activator NlpD
LKKLRLSLLSILLSILVLPLLLEPSSATTSYLFPIEGCKSKYSRYHHDYPAADIFTKAGCAFIAPVDGVVTEVSRVDTWSGRENLGSTRGGKFVAIVGSDGVRYYGSHLRSVAKGIEPGLPVTAGMKLGEVGTSGSARGTPPHLHFGISWPTEDGIWWVRRGMISPYPFLTAWESGEMKSPKRQVKRLLLKMGEVPKEPKK